MAHLIDKDTVVAEIERIQTEECPLDTYEGRCKSLWFQRFHTFLNSLDVKDVDLEKELIEWHKEHFKKDGTFIGKSGFYLTNNSQMDIAKHFFELGLKARQG